MIKPCKESGYLRPSLFTSVILLALVFIPAKTIAVPVARLFDTYFTQIFYPFHSSVPLQTAIYGDGFTLLRYSHLHNYWYSYNCLYFEQHLTHPFLTNFLHPTIQNTDFSMNPTSENLALEQGLCSRISALSQSQPSPSLTTPSPTRTKPETTLKATESWWLGWLSIPLLSGFLWWLVKDRATVVESVTTELEPRQLVGAASLRQSSVVTEEGSTVSTSLVERTIFRNQLPSAVTRQQRNQQSEQVRFREELMVNSRRHCFYIDPIAMHKIQKQTAVSMVLQPGRFDIKLRSGMFDYRIESGRYGEPLVLLWLYGGKVVNHKTGVEVGTTWSSLNGYEDALVLDVREPTTLSAFFIDTHLDDNEGEVLVTVEGENQVASLIVHSQENCYRIDAASVRQLEQEHSVCRVLQVGTYEMQIQSGTFNCRANSGQAGEPLVLLWIYGGKVVNRKTGIEVGATWSSLNGYEDVLTLEVREPATLCAFFFDTYLDDNEGTVVLSIVTC